VELFLRAKAWHLFVLLCGGMMFAFALLGYAAEIAVLAYQAQTSVPLWCWLATIPSFVWTALLLAWYGVLGTRLSNRAPESVRMSAALFRAALGYAFVYLAIYCSVPWIAFGSFGPTPGFAMLGVIVPLHLLAMVCMLYVLYFVARSLRMAETQQNATFYDYSGPFFLLWFFPIGVWVIQPRINRMFADAGKASDA